MIGFNTFANTVIGFLHLCRFNSRNFLKALCFDFWLINIPGITRALSLHCITCGLIINPRKSYPFGYFFSDRPRRFTIFVFSGCNSNLHDRSRFLICRFMYLACRSVLQCTTKSSAYVQRASPDDISPSIYQRLYVRIDWTIADLLLRLEGFLSIDLDTSSPR